LPRGREWDRKATARERACDVRRRRFIFASEEFAEKARSIFARAARLVNAAEFA
jgi:hypothetical protein